MKKDSGHALADRRGSEPTSRRPPAPLSTALPLARAAKTAERVASAVVADIVNSDLKPGDRLPNEAAMIDHFQVGRGSLREALRILEIHGLISLRSGPGGGPMVTEVGARDVARTFSLYLHLKRATMAELIEARLSIEPLIARMAAEKCTDDDLRRLNDAVTYESSLPDGDPDFLAAANNFHYVLATMSGNSVMNLLATALKEPYTTRVVAKGLIDPIEQARLRNEHAAIAKAISRRDARKAERLAHSHAVHYFGAVGEADDFASSPILWE